MIPLTLVVTQRALSKSCFVGQIFASLVPVLWGITLAFCRGDVGAILVSSSLAEITETPLSCLTPSSEGLVSLVEVSKR